MRWTTLLLLLGGCGRIAFDPINGDAIDGDAACLVDDFSSGVAGWTVILGTTGPGSGPDGSPALALTGAQENVVTAPALAGTTSARFSADFYLSAVNADFDVVWMKPPFSRFAMASGYRAGVFPVTGDSPTDLIQSWVAGAETILIERPNTISVSTWHHVTSERRVDGSMQIDLDGAPYLTSPPDLSIAPPYDVYVRIFDGGMLDNVRIDCTR